MSGLPEVESLVTVLNGVEEGRDKVGRQEEVECIDWFQCETTGDSNKVVSIIRSTADGLHRYLRLTSF